MMNVRRTDRGLAHLPSPSARRVRGLASVPAGMVADLGPGHADVLLSGAADHHHARLASLGLRRVHYVVIRVADGNASCMLAESTRTPVRRRVSLGAALALTEQGVPTYVTDRRGG